MCCLLEEQDALKPAAAVRAAVIPRTKTMADVINHVTHATGDV